MAGKNILDIEQLEMILIIDYTVKTVLVWLRMCGGFDWIIYELHTKRKVVK